MHENAFVQNMQAGLIKKLRVPLCGHRARVPHELHRTEIQSSFWKVFGVVHSPQFSEEMFNGFISLKYATCPGETVRKPRGSAKRQSSQRGRTIGCRWKARKPFPRQIATANALRARDRIEV